MESGCRSTMTSGCRHTTGGAPVGRDYLFHVHHEQVLIQRMTEYSVSSIGLPPHAALYPHIYGNAESRDPLTPPETPVLSTCQRLQSRGDARPAQSIQCASRSSPKPSDSCPRRHVLDHAKALSAIKHHHCKNNRRSRGVSKSHTRICVRRSDGVVSIVADDFLLKEVDRAMAIFIMRRKTRGQGLTIKEVRNKANEVVAVLRGKRTLYRVGRKWARVFLRRPDNTVVSQNRIFYENPVALTQRLQRLHWKKANVARYLLDYSDESETNLGYGDVPRKYPILWWRTMDSRFVEPTLSTTLSISSEQVSAVHNGRHARVGNVELSGVQMALK